MDTYIALVNAEGRALRDVGAEREARQVETLESYLRTRQDGQGQANDNQSVSAPEGDTDRPAAANVDGESA